MADHRTNGGAPFVPLEERHPLLRRPLYVYDLPSEILKTIQHKHDAAHPHSEEDIPPLKSRDADSNTSENGRQSRDSAGSQQSLPPGTSCSLCSLTFPSVAEQRAHVRSDLHGYNMKQRMRGAQSVTEGDFEKLVGDLDESLSGSDDSSEEDDDEEDSKDGTMLSALLKKQANLSGTADDDFSSTKKRKRGAGKPPLLWFSSAAIPSDTSLGIYRALFSSEDQLKTETALTQTLLSKQLAPKPPPAELAGGGVALPSTLTTPHIFLCMIGGGHFAAMIVSLAPKAGKKHGADERQAAVLAHKTFHRYTTRRKQGGSQAANDSAKGAAHSAGSSLRRYNEAALTSEVRDLLGEWRELIKSAELLFIRATGATNRRTLFGPYDGHVLRHDDPRNRGFPFSTRRPTQAELMRCFIELTRVKVSTVDAAAVAAAQAEAAAAAAEAASTPPRAANTTSTPPKPSPEEEAAALHTSQITALVRRSKAPALLSYLTTHRLSPDYALQHQHHAPTPLHLSSSANSAALVLALLLKAGADPGVTNADGKTAFELAGDRPTRDAFRQARAELGEERWAWDDARVTDALSRTDVEARNRREKEEEVAEAKREREAGLRGLEEAAARREREKGERGDERRVKKHGAGVLLKDGRTRTAEERREEETRGLTPEMRMRLEREKRARAAEERMKRLAGS